MKRSEAIYEILEVLEAGRLEHFNSAVIANQILEKLEALGMLPPAVNSPLFTHEHDGYGILSPVHEWDSE